MRQGSAVSTDRWPEPKRHSHYCCSWHCIRVEDLSCSTASPKLWNPRDSRRQSRSSDRNSANKPPQGHGLAIPYRNAHAAIGVSDRRRIIGVASAQQPLLVPLIGCAHRRRPGVTPVHLFGHTSQASRLAQGGKDRCYLSQPSRSGSNVSR